RLHQVNAEAVAAGRQQSREALIAAGRQWAEIPKRTDRALAKFLLGDVAMHHQDVLRGLGRTRQLCPVEEAAVVCECVSLTFQKMQPTLFKYRGEPTNGIGRPRGRGTRVRGT